MAARPARLRPRPLIRRPPLPSWLQLAGGDIEAVIDPRPHGVDHLGEFDVRDHRRRPIELQRRVDARRLFRSSSRSVVFGIMLTAADLSVSPALTATCGSTPHSSGSGYAVQLSAAGTIADLGLRQTRIPASLSGSISCISLYASCGDVDVRRHALPQLLGIAHAGDERQLQHRQRLRRFGHLLEPLLALAATSMTKAPCPSANAGIQMLAVRLVQSLQQRDRRGRGIPGTWPSLLARLSSRRFFRRGLPIRFSQSTDCVVVLDVLLRSRGNEQQRAAAHVLEDRQRLGAIHHRPFGRVVLKPFVSAGGEKPDHADIRPAPACTGPGSARECRRG